MNVTKCGCVGDRGSREHGRLPWALIRGLPGVVSWGLMHAWVASMDFMRALPPAEVPSRRLRGERVMRSII
jgi:hypothetical protein